MTDPTAPMSKLQSEDWTDKHDARLRELVGEYDRERAEAGLSPDKLTAAMVRREETTVAGGQVFGDFHASVLNNKVRSLYAWRSKGGKQPVPSSNVVVANKKRSHDPVPADTTQSSSSKKRFTDGVGHRIIEYFDTSCKKDRIAVLFWVFPNSQSTVHVADDGRRVEIIMEDRMSDPKEVADPDDVSQTEAILAHFNTFGKREVVLSVVLPVPVESAYTARVVRNAGGHAHSVLVTLTPRAERDTTFTFEI